MSCHCIVLTYTQTDGIEKNMLLRWYTG